MPELDFEAFEPAVRRQLEGSRRHFVERSASLEDTELAEAYVELGQVHHAYSLFGAAEVCYRNSLDLVPGDRRATYLLAHARLGSGEMAASLPLFREVVDRGGDLATWIALGQAAADLGEIEQARAALDQAQAQLPTAKAHFLLGEIAAELGESRTAIDHFRAALDLQPEATKIQLPLALACRAVGDDACAEEALQGRGEGPIAFHDPWLSEVRALEVGARARTEVGVAALRDGRFSEAEAAFRSALESDPEHLSARANLGAALQMQGRSAAAAEILRRVLEQDPGQTQSRYNLARMEAEQGNDAAAVEQYQALLAVDPGHSEARFNLANALLRLGRFEECAEAYRAVNAERPRRTPSRLGEVVCWTLAGDERAALGSLRAARQLLPEAPELIEAEARLLAAGRDAAIRDADRSLALAQSLIASTSTLDHVVTLAMALAAVGEFEQATQWQQRAIAAVRQQGREDLLEPLSDDLARYSKGQPCRDPWRGHAFDADW